MSMSKAGGGEAARASRAVPYLLLESRPGLWPALIPNSARHRMIRPEDLEGMSAVTQERIYTPPDLLSLPESGKGLELVGGRLVEKRTGGFASFVAARVVCLLAAFGQDRGLGWVFDSEGSYQCFPDDPRRVRKPNVSFVRRGRLPEERIPAGHILIPPDLAVEVVSPSDTAYEVDVKVQEYLAAEVPLVWVVNPETRTVQVYRGDGTVERLRELDELTAPDLFPDLSYPVAGLFTLPVAALG